MTSHTLDRLLKSLSSQLHAFSVCRIQSGWRLAFPAFDALTVHFVLRGSGAVSVGGGSWLSFAPGNLIIVPPRQPHVLGEAAPGAREVPGDEHCALLGDGLVAFTAGDGSADTLLACGTIPRLDGGALGLFDLLRKPAVEDFSPDGVQRPILDVMFAEVTRPALGTQAVTEALMQQCLMLLLRRQLVDGDGPALFTGLRQPRLMAAVVAILENPAAPHSVESLAALTGMSRASFAEHFSRGFGQGPIDFVQKARLRVAARLLSTTQLPVKVIAESIGYASRSYFSRAFHAAYGIGPRGYRSGSAGAALPKSRSKSPQHSSEVLHINMDHPELR